MLSVGGAINDDSHHYIYADLTFVTTMATLTVHHLDEEIKKQLQFNASQHNCSIEEEVRRILKQALFPSEHPKKLGSYLHQQIMELTGGADLDMPGRSLPRSLPDFSEPTQ